MKSTIPIIMALLTIACTNDTNDTATYNSQEQQDRTQEISIDSVIVKEQAFKERFFLIRRSTFPKISGLTDHNFENKVNEIFSNNINSFIENKRQELGLPVAPPTDKENNMYDIPASVTCSFEVLTKSDSLISVVQYFTEQVGHGGNSWTSSSFALTFDFKNKVIYQKKEFKIDKQKTNYLNSKIKTFFDNLFPEEKINSAINYPFIKTSNDFDKLNFGIRNDSLILIIQAYPTAHYSYSTYIIPIEKFN